MASAKRALTFGVAVVTASLLAAMPVAGQDQEQDQDKTIYTPGNGVTTPTAIKSAYASYSSEAMKAGIEGCHEVEVVVFPDATVGNAKLIKSLDSKYGMDERALESAKKWVFKPGTKDGKPVAVRVTIQSCFTIGKAKAKKSK